MSYGAAAQSSRSVLSPVAARHNRRMALGAALRTMSYEVLPLKGADELVTTHLRIGSSVTVTTTQARPGATLDLAEKLAAAGYRVTPHIAARDVRDDAHLTDIVARLGEASIDRIFVVGGDIRHPVGSFADALSLLRTLEQQSHRFTMIGIAGYPEGHGSIDATLINDALARKSPYASEIVTQLCFHPHITARWARGVKTRRIALPIRVGIPGAVPRRKLARISAKLGLGPSARFISKQHGMLGRFFLPGGYHPKRLVDGLTPWLASTGTNIAGFHLFTFNELQRTEAWRRAWLQRLEQHDAT